MYVIVFRQAVHTVSLSCFPCSLLPFLHKAYFRPSYGHADKQRGWLVQREKGKNRGETIIFTYIPRKEKTAITAIHWISHISDKCLYNL